MKSYMCSNTCHKVETIMLYFAVQLFQLWYFPYSLYLWPYWGVVYTNVDLKQELNAKSQSLNGQLNSSNEHMQILLDSILAVQSNISKQGDEISRDLSRIQSVIGNLSSSAFSPGTLANPAASCTDIPRDRPSGNYWIQTNNVDSPFQAFCDMDQTYCSCNAGKGVDESGQY